MRLALIVSSLLSILLSKGLRRIASCCLDTAREIQGALAASQSKILAWAIEYEFHDPDDSAKPSRSGHTVRRLIAAKIPDKLLNWTAHGCDLYPWQDDPPQQRISGDSAKCVEEHVFDRAYFPVPMHPGDFWPGTSKYDIIFLSLGWWSVPSLRPALLGNGAPSVIQEIAKSSNYVCRHELEWVNQCWCHVLEFPLHDRLWIDCDHGFTIAKREIIDPRTGLLEERVELSGYREISPGIWAPREIHNILFDNSSLDLNHAAAVKVESIGEIRRILVNEQVTDDLFVYHPMPGSIRLTDDGGYQQDQAGGLDYLDHLNTILSNSRRPRVESEYVASVNLESVLEISACATAWLAIVAVWRHRFVFGKTCQNRGGA